MIPAIGLPRLPRSFGSSSPIFMPVPAVVVLRLSLIVSWIAAVHRPTPGWGKDSGDCSKLLEGGFTMGEFEGGSFVFQVFP